MPLATRRLEMRPQPIRRATLLEPMLDETLHAPTRVVTPLKAVRLDVTLPAATRLELMLPWVMLPAATLLEGIEREARAYRVRTPRMLVTLRTQQTPIAPTMIAPTPVAAMPIIRPGYLAPTTFRRDRTDWAMLNRMLAAIMLLPMRQIVEATIAPAPTHSDLVPLPMHFAARRSSVIVRRICRGRIRLDKTTVAGAITLVPSAALAELPTIRRRAPMRFEKTWKLCGNCRDAVSLQDRTCETCHSGRSQSVPALNPVPPVETIASQDEPAATNRGRNPVVDWTTRSI